MEVARTIRESVEAVGRLRRQAAADPPLAEALTAIKQLQSRRFAGTYADLLRGATYAAPARFFLDELYGVQDFALRDQQFGRIAGTIETMFPAQVAQTAAGLARLHALTEDLDLHLARSWVQNASAPTPALRYAIAWKQLGREPERRDQLARVVAMGVELARMARMPGLRTMLRMMRGPASAAGLQELQRFLERGFDTFAGMARQRGAVETFLDTVNVRETRWLELLFGADLATCETELARTLGQVP
jgi:hypothetical protein